MSVEAIKAAVDELIAAGTSFDVQALDRIYHDDMRVVMIDMDGNVNEANKAAFKGLFEAKKAEGAAPLNTWAQYNSVTAEDEVGHVMITRKVNLMGQDQILILSIDLVFEDGRWQVTREVIFARDENEG
ncbi:MULTISPECIES: nuclear transport factor 2 family protein [unclassified Ruegeria]|uniref:nuclear transport factor 2 family protein n=1 Tax=unclassified Ruegeria TaxID=2625375 RepID=UPI001489AD39|nr:MULTISPECIES: nuclear transport factor 2 family protein [unclassified Ruegeria]